MHPACAQAGPWSAAACAPPPRPAAPQAARRRGGPACERPAWIPCGLQGQRNVTVDRIWEKFDVTVAAPGVFLVCRG
eukprot:scaffold116321_cov63-Phaeocystis_antarctica.AAC.2